MIASSLDYFVSFFENNVRLFVSYLLTGYVKCDLNEFCFFQIITHISIVYPSLSPRTARLSVVSGSYSFKIGGTLLWVLFLECPFWGQHGHSKSKKIEVENSYIV